MPSSFYRKPRGFEGWDSDTVGEAATQAYWQATWKLDLKFKAASLQLGNAPPHLPVLPVAPYRAYSQITGSPSLEGAHCPSPSPSRRPAALGGSAALGLPSCVTNVVCAATAVSLVTVCTSMRVAAPNIRLLAVPVKDVKLEPREPTLPPPLGPRLASMLLGSVSRFLQGTKDTVQQSIVNSQ